ncbi:hypothetical protein FACS189468_5780 [Spirochaetia bacterium]|nr:hypothetical protein FACS189468_5780 [Spirochaetia bacterium]
MVQERFTGLRALGEAISQFSSIGESQMLQGVPRDEHKLIESLVALAPTSHLLHIPARVVAVRSFLVAKFHAFSLLFKILGEDSEYYEPVRKVMYSIIFTLMAEDVYFSCLNGPSFPDEIKFRLAEDLISLWDSGTDLASIRHFPALEALWTARNGAPPSFGTMDGTSEVLRLSIDLGDDWQEFLVDQVSNEEAKWALEEFLFGLSYEELYEVRSRLRRFGISAVNFDEVRFYLGRRPAYSVVKNPDPRAIYDFYVDRRDAAIFRKQTAAAGPHKTLEEIYLIYRITEPVPKI